MPICMRCGEVIGKGHVCRACQVEFSKEMAAKGRKKAYALSFFGIVAAVFTYSKIPPGSISQLKGNAITGYHQLIPATQGFLEQAREPTSILDIQARMIFTGVVFTLVGSFALLTFAKKWL